MTQDNVFSHLMGGSPAPQPSTAAPRGVVLPAPPKQPSPQTPAQAQGDVLANALTQEKIADLARGRREDEEKAATAKRADDIAMAQLMRVIGKLNEIGLDATDNKSFPGLGETGTSGNIMRGVPVFNNPAKDLQANIDTLRANFAFDALQAMRDASKTGGALGQVSEIELQLLERAVANVDPSQGHEQFINNLQQARQAYLAKLAMINPQLATRLGYDQAKAEEAMLSLNDAFNQEFGGGVEMTINRDATAPERPPEDVEAILRKYGVE